MTYAQWIYPLKKFSMLRVNIQPHSFPIISCLLCEILLDILCFLGPKWFSSKWLFLAALFQIALGSTNVRVGSTIFGARVYKNKPGVDTPAPSTTFRDVQEATEKIENLDVNK